MTTPQLTAVENKIAALKQRIVRLGDMRPGTLSVQYRNPAQQRTPFHQISYTHQGKSRSEYVRPANLPVVRRELANYRTFKTIAGQLVTLSITASRLRCATRPTSPPTTGT